LNIARDTPGGPRSPRSFAAFAAAFAGYTFVTAILLRPVVAHLTTRIPHDLGDPLLSMTLLWWTAHVTPLTERWWNGFAFWPGTGMMAFSDHRLGESLIASPLQWMGASALTAYNVTLLLTFPLCAIAAHWAAYTLTKRHDASVLAGLAYGFSPYRFAHIEHLELLGAFGMPAALAALHLYVEQRRIRWLIAFGAAILVQSLLCSYYSAFFVVLLALWIPWFIRRNEIACVAGIGATLLIVAALLAPILWSYIKIHQQYVFVREYNTVILLSADVASYAAASPLMTLWGWTSRFGGGELQLFPGLTIVVLIVVGAVAAVRSEGIQASTNRVALIAAGLGVLGTLIAAIAAYNGGWRISIGGTTLLSIGTPFKTFSLAFVAFCVAALAASPARHAFRRRSPFAFYVIAAAFLALCSLGPKARFLGYQFLYEPPYAWLMEIRTFGESIRVPARFAMPAILALSIAAALSFARLTRASASRRLFTIALALAIVADSWIVPLPTFELPPMWASLPPAQGAPAFLELPLGEVEHDIAAMYRAMAMNWRTVNGNSGYIPDYYQAANIGLEERDDTVLSAIATHGPIIVAVRRNEEEAAERLAWLRALPGAEPLSDDRDAWFFRVTGSAPAPIRCDGAQLRSSAASDRHGSVDIRPLTDNDPNTYWSTTKPQQPGDMIQFDLGEASALCSIRLSLGTFAALYPRRLNVATSIDGESWTTVFDGRTGGAAVLSALERPSDARIEIPLGGGAARFIRLRLDEGSAKASWVISDVAVTASAQR
jgi:F5/8 type C domain-containing protein